MPKLKDNRLGIAIDVDRIPGFEQQSLRKGAFVGCRHSEVLTHTEMPGAGRFPRFAIGKMPDSCLLGRWLALKCERLADEISMRLPYSKGFWCDQGQTGMVLSGGMKQDPPRVAGRSCKGVQAEKCPVRHVPAGPDWASCEAVQRLRG